MPRRLRREPVTREASANDLFFGHRGDDRAGPRSNLDDGGEIVDEVRRDSMAAEDSDRLDPVVAIEDDEVALGHQDGSLQLNVPPDLFRELLEKGRPNLFVRAQAADLDDFKPHGRCRARGRLAAGHRNGNGPA